MTAIAKELERTMERLEPEKARVLELRVREAISEVEVEEEPLTIEEIKRMHPEWADVIGCWADVEFELPPDLPWPKEEAW